MLRLENTEKDILLTNFRDMKSGDIGYIRKWPSGSYFGSLVMKTGTNLFSLNNPSYYWTSLDESLPGLLIEVLPKGTKLSFVVE